MNAFLIVLRADGQPWVPHRNARLNAWGLLRRLSPIAHVSERVVAQMNSPEALRCWLLARREGLPQVNRFEEESYILAFEGKLKREGKPKLHPREHALFRRWGAKHDICFGLDVGTELFEVWQQCVARWHGRSANEIPRSVQLILAGCRNLDAVEEDIAFLLEDDYYLRRVRNLPAPAAPDLRETLIRQWVTASGGIQKHLARAGKMLGQDKDHQLAELATAGGYEKLAPEMVDLALQLAGGDKRLAFFVFRCMQRVAACTVAGEAMWMAEWLRGAKANPDAIPGTTGKPNLVEIVQNEILGEVTKGHSGAAGIPTTYRLKIPIQAGTCGPHEAAERLGINLNKKGLPRR